jgi:EAL domain-containing protein (putative c-di-GMP-specific phosphodiesterase class I)
VEGVVTTCKRLGIRTVAEMVEKEDQHRILLDLGVGLGRAGYTAVRRPRSRRPPPPRFGKRLGAKEMWG